ncbi:MAG: HD domain-containing protein [Tissierellia bacterium]|nr:HD domain-containing protein [Tissierellia bacterium]
MLDNKLKFIIEVDKLKTVNRMTSIIGNSRKENDAEHSFHVALMAHVLASYADRPIDPNRVSKMLLIHDVVEIDAGDTFAYDEEGYKDKEEREEKAAKRLFGLLNDDGEYYRLWREFEDMETDDSLFANGLDRLQPMLLNYFNGGGTWKSHNITKEKVYKRLEPLQKISITLWNLGTKYIDDYFEHEK